MEVPAEPSVRVIPPLYLCRVEAGFPSPADDHIDKELDLNEHLVRRPNATFFTTVRGYSMVGAGIPDGDLSSSSKSFCRPSRLFYNLSSPLYFSHFVIHYLNSHSRSSQSLSKRAGRKSKVVMAA